MNTLAIHNLFEEFIKDFEMIEGHSILFYSKDHQRDFKIMNERIKRYRDRLTILLAENGEQYTGETRDSVREKDLSE